MSVEELDDEEDPGDIPSLPTTPGDELGKTPDRVSRCTPPCSGVHQAEYQTKIFLNDAV